MKLNFLNKNKLPKIGTLRPPLFNAEKYWRLALLSFVVIFITTALIGLKFFHAVYFETYKEKIIIENPTSLLNLNNLKTAVDRRSAYILESPIIPPDPSK